MFNLPPVNLPKMLPRDLTNVELPPETENAGTIARPALRKREMAAAFGLVYEKYFKLGYVDSCPQRKRFSLLQLLPACRVLILTDRKNQLLATATLNFDSYNLLPLDRSFSADVDSYRAQGKKIAEGTLFASKGDENTNTTNGIFDKHVFKVFRSMFKECQRSEIDVLCMVVNPHHLAFWQRIGFVATGEEKACSYVKDAPGVLIAFDSTRFHPKGENPLPSFLTKILSISAQDDYQWPVFSLNECEVLEFLDSNPLVLQESTEAERKLFKEIYPSIKLETSEPQKPLTCLQMLSDFSRIFSFSRIF